MHQHHLNKLLALGVAAALLAALPLSAAPARGFNRERIHADYQSGEFERVIAALERFVESGRRCPKTDSVFLEKHLAVVYAANPKTRELGRYHMFRMLSIEPASDILDMFVGEEVDGIFDKVRKEFAVTRAPAAPSTAPAAGRLSPVPVREAAKSAPPPAGAAPARPAKPPVPPLSAFSDRYPTPKLKPWKLDDVPRTASLASIAVAPASAPAGPSKPAVLTRPALRPRAEAAASHTAAPAQFASAKPLEVRPRWREPGFWVGSGAAVAVVGLTVYFAGSHQWDEPVTRTTTYAVPAKTSD